VINDNIRHVRLYVGGLDHYFVWLMF